MRSEKNKSSCYWVAPAQMINHLHLQTVCYSMKMNIWTLWDWAVTLSSSIQINISYTKTRGFTYLLTFVSIILANHTNNIMVIYSFFHFLHIKHIDFDHNAHNSSFYSLPPVYVHCSLFLPLSLPPHTLTHTHTHVYMVSSEQRFTALYLCLLCLNIIACMVDT